MDGNKEGRNKGNELVVKYHLKRKKQTLLKMCDL